MLFFSFYLKKPQITSFSGWLYQELFGFAIATKPRRYLKSKQKSKKKKFKMWSCDLAVVTQKKPKIFIDDFMKYLFNLRYIQPRADMSSKISIKQTKEPNF